MSEHSYYHPQTKINRNNAQIESWVRALNTNNYSKRISDGLVMNIGLLTIENIEIKANYEELEINEILNGEY